MKYPRKRSQELVERRKRTVRVLLYLNSAMWLLNGGNIIYKMIADSNTVTAALVAFFFLINILALILVARILEDREKWVYVTALVILEISTLLIFIGFPDILDAILLLINAAIFVNLIPLKAYYYKEA